MALLTAHNDPEKSQQTAGKTLWNKRRPIGFGGLIGVFIGLTIAFLWPVWYTSTTKLLPELEPGQAINLKSFQQLAAISGVELESKPKLEALRPDLYPDVLNTTPFALALLHTKVYPSNEPPKNLCELLDSRAGYWTRCLSTADPIGKLPLPIDTIIRLTTAQQELVDFTKSLIKTEMDAKTGAIQIKVRMPDPEVAAQMAQFAATYLQQFVQSYRTDKARADEKFVREQLNRTKLQVQQAEKEMLLNQDRTLRVTLPSATLPNRHLADDYQSDNELFQELKREHAHAQLRVQAVTPVFKVLEPAQVPDRRSSPRRTAIVAASTLSGAILMAFFVFVRGALGFS